jgi:pyruvate dehydrogenase complex dehydrogenase (E1) component
MNFDNRVPFLIGVFASILDAKKTNIATDVRFLHYLNHLIRQKSIFSRVPASTAVSKAFVLGCATCRSAVR